MRKDRSDGAAPGRGVLLCVANFPSGTGFAWEFIESLFAATADFMWSRGRATLVAYPALPVDPKALAGSAARPVEFAFSVGTLGGIWRSCRFVREQNVRILYLIDHPSSHVAFVALRLSGVRRIVVHDHTSGERVKPGGLKRLAKWLFARIPAVTADRVLAVSDFVARRKLTVDLVPRNRVQRIWNAVPDTYFVERPETNAREEFGACTDQELILCACRAHEVKGVQHLLRAFDLLMQTYSRTPPLLVYVGDGPYLPELLALRETLAAKEHVRFAGKRSDAPSLAGTADLVVVPSIWQEAFGLAALEAMARGVPVIASAVGGLLEIVKDGITGMLVPPGDEAALAEALETLLSDPVKRRQIGLRARQHLARDFSRSRQIAALNLVFAGIDAEASRH